MTSTENCDIEGAVRQGAVPQGGAVPPQNTGVRSEPTFLHGARHLLCPSSFDWMGVLFGILASLPVAIFTLGLGIPTLIFAFSEENDSCQKGTRGGLTLSDWSKGAGFNLALSTLIMMIALSLNLATKRKGPAQFSLILLGFGLVFTVMWEIWGIVVIATAENNQCVADGSGMAIMAIINIVCSPFYFVPFVVVYGVREDK